jgi:hypothetical protein
LSLYFFPGKIIPSELKQGKMRMEDVRLLDENWKVILSLFPDNWKELARETGAIVRKLRTFSSEDAVIRTLLIHIAQGYSLRETVVKAKAADIANVSDVALLKRLRLSELWLKELCKSLFNERGIKTSMRSKAVRMRLVDASNVKEPGKTGSLWRIHYSLQIPELKCDFFKLTATKGDGSGETYKHFPVNEGDCIIGDRGYSTAQGIEHLANLNAFSLVRVCSQTIKFYTKNGISINLLPKLKQLKNADQIGEWMVCVKKEDGSFIAGRICAIRKSEHAIKEAIKKIKRNASKKQTVTKPQTLEFAKYVIVFTTLPEQDFKACSVLEWYRLRWQIELIFKRLKSLAGLGHLPKYDDASSRAWLYGKLFVGLLVEKLISQAETFSPWGYGLG